MIEAPKGRLAHAVKSSQSWIAKAKYALEGVIYEYDEADDPDEITKIKQVPSDSIVATFDGTWRGDINYKLKGDRVRRVLSLLIPLLC